MRSDEERGIDGAATGGSRGSEQELRAHPVLEEPWYHRIELLPGVFSPAEMRPNLIVTRKLFAGCEVEGQKVLDVGAMDCLMTLLALRRGAERVIAYDRPSSERHARFLQEVFGVTFDYVSGKPLSTLAATCRELGAYPFDMVLFSGVLYHMFDPMAGLARARGLVRDGGLVLIETAAVVDPGFRMHFNAAGRFHPATTYWLISVDCLDYLCRFVGLAPIDCAYLHGRTVSLETGLRICRIAVLCRAVDRAPATEDDAWFTSMAAPGKGGSTWDFKEHASFSELAAVGRPELAHQPSTEDLVRHDDTGTVDLYRSVQATEPLSLRDERLQCLHLGDRV